MKNIAVLALSLMLAACGAGNNDFGPNAAATGANTHVIAYIVNGPVSTASVTYQNDQGGTSQEIVDVPWQKQIGATPGQSLFLFAQNQDSAGYLTVAIGIDGTLYKQTTALGAFASATVSGACC